MRVFVTGADGFVGRWLCAELLAHGSHVVGGVRSGPSEAVADARWREVLGAVRWVPLELGDRGSVERAVAERPDAIVHLAAVASGAEARANPVAAWAVNCLGTCELVYALERAGFRGRLVFASTGEVYGRVPPRPITETDPVAPCSPYAASKAAAEQVVLESHRRSGADVVIARAFAQAGVGQRDSFVVPALARRILAAKEAGHATIPVGNLDPVREFVDVRDMAAALRLLLERGEAGGVYNVAAGRGAELREVFAHLAELAGWEGRGEPDASLYRAADIPYLVGEGGKIAALGWRPKYQLADTLADLMADLRTHLPAAPGAASGR